MSVMVSVTSGGAAPPIVPEAGMPTGTGGGTGVGSGVDVGAGVAGAAGPGVGVGEPTMIVPPVQSNCWLVCPFMQSVAELKG